MLPKFLPRMPTAFSDAARSLRHSPDEASASFNRGARQQLELSAILRSLSDWQKLLADDQRLTDPQFIGELARRIVHAGAREPVTDVRIPSGELKNLDNLREGLTYSWINSRLRAVMLCIEEALGEKPYSDVKIYATEAVTPFALKLRGNFAKFIGSEYTESDEQRADLFPIPCEDLQRLSFPTDIFDVVTTNEVLEHVPSLDAALSEICRVLRPGGWHIGTAPFAMGQYESIRRARLEGDEIVHLMEPEYHGNPVDERGSLVFEIPGWDILDRAKAAGFSDAYVKYVISSHHACLSSDAGGIFVFCLQK